MRKYLTTARKFGAVILPEELLEPHGFGNEAEMEPTGGGLILRPVKSGLTFARAKEKLFRGKHGYLVPSLAPRTPPPPFFC